MLGIGVEPVEDPAAEALVLPLEPLVLPLEALLPLHEGEAEEPEAEEVVKEVEAEEPEAEEVVKEVEEGHPHRRLGHRRPALPADVRWDLPRPLRRRLLVGPRRSRVGSRRRLRNSRQQHRRPHQRPRRNVRLIWRR